jgi:hypothetical protein
LAGGVNLYSYAGSNPIAFSDPFGLCPIPPSTCFGRAGADLGIGLVPIVSTLHDVATAISGTNVITGERVGLAGRLVAIAGALTPASGGQIRAGASTAQEVTRALIRNATTNPHGWRTVGAFTEPATTKAARGGVSIQKVIENEAGDQLVEHTVLDKAGRAVDGPHYRPNYKPRDVDRPPE